MSMTKKKSSSKKKPKKRNLSKKLAGTKKKAHKKTSKKKSVKEVSSGKQKKAKKKSTTQKTKKKATHPVKKISVKEQVDKKLTDFFPGDEEKNYIDHPDTISPGDEEKSKPLDIPKDIKKQKDAPDKSPFKENIDLIDDEGLHEDQLHGDDFVKLRSDESDIEIENDENIESFQENDYPADEEEEEVEMSFDDPFDNLDDLEEDEEDEEGSLF